MHSQTEDWPQLPKFDKSWRQRFLRRGSTRAFSISLISLAVMGGLPCSLGMFLVTEADADAIRTVFHRDGELSAAIELRRRFPGITDNVKARACARTIAGWTPLPAAPASVIPLRPRGTKAGRRDDPYVKG